MHAVVRTSITALALWVAIRILPGLEFSGSVLSLIGIALVIGVVNTLVRPIMTLLALPLVLATLGLFLVVVNTLAMWLALAISRALDLGLTSANLGWTFLATLVISIVSWLLNAVLVRD
jgi:putative membrane protein